MTTLDPVFSNERLQPLALESSRRLSAYAQNDIQIQITGSDGPAVTLPAKVVQMLVEILAQLAQGNAVHITPYHAELTTQQAADFLGVSRPHVVKLLEAGKIEHRKVGTHRRIQFKALLDFRNEMLRKRHAVLDELIAEAQEHGDGY